jgi:hypothetical protein
MKGGNFMLNRLVLAVAILVSAPCWNALAETEAERRACTPDAQSLCADEMPDRDRVYACMIRRVDAISNPTCRKIIQDSINARRRDRRSGDAR